MFAVQIGNYAWLGEDGFVTTSIKHAARIVGNLPAAVRAQQLRDNLGPALVHLNRKQRDFYTTTPVTVIAASELDARWQAITRPGDRGTAAVTTDVRLPGPADKEATVRKEGITRQIYNWTLANPQATKADAMAAWPAANPSTVSVQFSAARRSMVS